jgi:hypothetical protein
MAAAMKSLGLTADHLTGSDGPTKLGATLEAYFAHRADVLNNFVEPRLMNAESAKKLFEELYATRQPRCPIPKNKQKGDKAGHSYLTGIVNMLIDAAVGDLPVNYDPRHLTTFTHDTSPLRTLSRRLDGAFPSTVNPIAIWEIKEYYYTTTFGSRIADGVFETQLDGMELEELKASEGVDIEHLLIVDAYYTWWTCGRSYLCRIIDMLHMGLVSEVLFGREVVEVLPRTVEAWVAKSRTTGIPGL